MLFLQIGLAVGDIDSIQQNAEYKRLSVKVICSLAPFKVQVSLNGVFSARGSHFSGVFILTPVMRR